MFVHPVFDQLMSLVIENNWTFFVIQASAYPEFHYQSLTKPYFSTEEKTIQLLRPATSYTPTLSELIIENIEQPLKCDAEFIVTINYYFVGETVEDFKTDIVYIVSTTAGCSLAMSSMHSSEIFSLLLECHLSVSGLVQRSDRSSWIWEGWSEVF